MISKENKLIQVKVSQNAYSFLKKYSDLVGVSISSFCESAINHSIIKHASLMNLDEYIKHPDSNKSFNQVLKERFNGNV